MASDLIAADYEILERVAQAFAEEQTRLQQVSRDVERQITILQDGAWQSQAADAFYADVHNDVMPSISRAHQALGQFADQTRQISKILRDAEEAAAALLINEPPEASRQLDEGGTTKPTHDFTALLQRIYNSKRATHRRPLTSSRHKQLTLGCMRT